MNRLAQKLTEIFGSAPFILIHLVWWAIWFITGQELELLVTIVSLEAILLALFILRAQNIEAARHSRDIKKDLRKSDKAIKLIKRRK